VAVIQKLAASSCGEIPIQDFYQTPYSADNIAKCYATYPMENGKWIFPWEKPPCYSPEELNKADFKEYKSR
jgi:hypothetical protein